MLRLVDDMDIYPSEDIHEFMDEYSFNKREVSSITMMKNLGEIDEFLLGTDTCWMISDNIHGILSCGVSADVLHELKSTDHKNIIPFLRKHLSEDRLIVIAQDQDSWDHWFTLIGQGEQVHLVEKSVNCLDLVETFTLDEISLEMQNILTGVNPDRFYGNKGPHSFNIWVHERGLLCKETVREYLQSPI